ncbi:thioredoxin family protein [Microcella humidisoli]|jgi:thiol-disulfide isomerase/thioredoxin|uniref:Thioredoxin family protein n=1 Tax=Microcella humidisoli TaxID=2963406 RepID=A0ABY5FY57_9MICO|nr:thioredoxin family protein [Microcella humidisoli]UTT63255.1 thioredoxin family protein [Microcella humidisoli]
MTTRTTIAAGAAIALMIGLGGCSTSAPLDVAAPVATAPAAEPSEPAPSEAVDDAEAEPVAAPGEYLDYYDGAIAETPGLKVLFFHASWCPKCRALDEDIEANAIPDGMTIFKVDFDTANDLKQRYGVTLQTTIVYVDDEGELLTKGVLYDDTTLDALIAAAP